MGDHKWNSQHSKEDQTIKISKSIFVTNFPEGCNARDLWKVRNNYGTVVDVFIPFKKSKAGKRFALVRFIKVINLDLLVENLQSNMGTSKESFASVLKDSQPPVKVNKSSKPALVLNDSCIKENDFSLSLIGKVNDVAVIPNLYTIILNEGFHNIKLSYLGGMCWIVY
ncbi:RNA-directed DNA polymerase, eukaryota, nucleotide-binding alpha-beta plait domain protein [Tanacetum coccineum]